MHEAPRILLELHLDESEPDRPEGLALALVSGPPRLVVQVAMSAEHFFRFDHDRPCSFQIPRDEALRLAHEILREWAPEIADAIERFVVAASLRVVSGSGPGPEAA